MGFGEAIAGEGFDLPEDRVRQRAEAGDLDPKVFYDVLRGSAAGAPYVGYKEAAFLTPETAPVGAPVALIRKDLELAVDLARRRRFDLPGSQTAHTVLDDATAAGLGEADMVEVLTALRLRNGPQI